MIWRWLARQLGEHVCDMPRWSKVRYERGVASEALLRARSLIEMARSAVKQDTGAQCKYCGSIPRADRDEYALNSQLIALGDKCTKLALSEFGQRPIKRATITERGPDERTSTSTPAR